jgi:thiamine biosynthesis lipoprotein
LTVVSDDQGQANQALHSTFAEMERQVVLFDHRNPRSPLYSLNQNGRLPEPPAELVRVFQRAYEIALLSNGAFDITVKPLVDARKAGQAIDESLLSLVDYRAVGTTSGEIRFSKPGMQATLDGIAKGTVVDGGVAALKAAGCPNVLVEAGGDLYVSGRPSSNDGWQIGITHPRPTQVSGYVAAFTLRSGSSATSGDYYQPLTADLEQHHIVDPRRGVSPAELASATVLAPDATTADALATAVMVLGTRDGLALANAMDGVEALIVTKKLEVRQTAGFPAL